jgi:zinc protease
MKRGIILLLAIGLFAGEAFSGEQGVRITELYSPESPIISFRIEVGAGSINDPKGKEGLNALTAFLLGRGGTRELSYDQLVEKLFPWAASIDVQPDKEVTVLTGRVHRDFVTPFYKILADLVREPRFDPNDFARNRELLLNYLQNTLRGNDDENLGKQALNLMLYRNHPYGTTEVGTVQGLEAITLEDVKAYHRRTWTRANIVVGIAGGYPKELLKTIQADFGKLPAGSVEPRKLPQPEKIENVDVMFVEKESRATAISLGFPIDVTRAQKDFYPLMVANSYFGEHRTFNGVLMKHIRELRGFNYGDYSYIENFIQDGGSTFPLPNIPRRQQLFSIWIRPVEHANRHFVLRQAMRELHLLVEKGLTKEDFEATRNFLLNYSKLWVQTLDRRLGYQMDSNFYGTEYFIDRIARELPKLTVEDVNAAIRRHLQWRNLKVAIVTKDAASFRDALLANTPSPVKYPTAMPAAILEEDKVIEVYPLEINKEKSQIVPATELFER